MSDRYRKKPVVIEARQFQRGDGTALAGWCGGSTVNEDCDGGCDIAITTLEGTMTASPGDWIIKGVANEFYPCKPDIFAATYEKVTQP